ncbi:von Willebrand factor type A domain protein [Aquisphaera giovannonii]|uniref:von Willebrand factor type A domain protein n=1 Tax=Aquisphaera giovannonii TaxID=406548 RepID=A0A5B9WCH0_9BACT|nr:VIT domain-containing protein [Aquisphaera giovannonii]QEH37745.1 von Willebrand factor type A domain protein [Aquisphaera giovannonii]
MRARQVLRRSGWGTVALIVGLSCAPGVLAQGFIVDRRPGIPIARSYEIREVAIDARVRDQVAEVQVSQTFHNPGSVQIESEFLFPLPEDGAVQNFVLMVDGRELPGRLMTKEEARRIYEEIVRSKRDPALLEYMGRGLYRTSVFPIPPGAERKVTMRYTQLCKRDRDLVEFSYPLSTQKFTTKPIQRLGVRIAISSKSAIKSIYSPSDDARIDRSGDHEARVSLERRDVVPSADFRLVYSLGDGAIGASVLSYRPSAGEDGYFLLLASPEVKAADSRPLPKTVVFVLDRSGSMAGKKIEQARKALKSVLNNLREDDLFNIVVYDDRSESFRPELQRYTSRTREEAERFVENIREGGSTNIDAALKDALAMIRDDSRPSYVLFLTDGLPTAGETQELKIAENCRRDNLRRAKIFSFGVGYDVNARLLDRLSGGNGGTSEYVKPDEDIEAHVGRFYAKLTSPVLVDTRIELSGTDVNRTYPRDVPDLFDGGQIVWVGRYRQSGPTTVRIGGKVGGERRSFEFPAELAEAGRGGGHDFVERIWATRRVGYLIDQIDMSGQNRELIDELVGLSTKYGIMTPYTSFLADERVPLAAATANAMRAGESAQALGSVSGEFGVSQRGLKQGYMQADRAAAAGAFAESERFAHHAMRDMGGYGPVPGMGGAGMGGMMGGRAGGAPARPQASAKAASSAPEGFGRRADGKDESRLAEGRATVRQLGAKTFYYKDNRWIDSTVKPDEDAKARRIRQFSDEFFALARSQSAEVNQYLTFGEPVTVNLDGTVYRIDPDEARP